MGGGVAQAPPSLVTPPDDLDQSQQLIDAAHKAEARETTHSGRLCPCDRRITVDMQVGPSFEEEGSVDVDGLVGHDKLVSVRNVVGTNFSRHDDRMELQAWSWGAYVISLSPARRRLSAQRRRASSSS